MTGEERGKFVLSVLQKPRSCTRNEQESMSTGERQVLGSFKMVIVSKQHSRAVIRNTCLENLLT